MVESNRFRCVLADLCWAENPRSDPRLVGSVTIQPDPLPELSEGTQVEQPTQLKWYIPSSSSTLDVTNGTAIEDLGTDSLQAQSLKIFYEFQGKTLGLAAVFMTLYAALVHIASTAPAEIAQFFTARYEKAESELQVDPYSDSPVVLQNFVYKDVAQVLEKLPKYMFDEGHFEETTFVWEKAGVSVGQGFLRKYANVASTKNKRAEFNN